VKLADAQSIPFKADRRPVVLVVEDEILIRTPLCQDIRSADFRVVEASSADDALALIRSGVAVDALLTDVRMPGSLDGFALAAAARAVLPNIALLVMSSAIAENHRMSLGPFEFIGKPFETRRLVARLRTLMGAADQRPVVGPEDRYIATDVPASSPVEGARRGSGKLD
jgi:DNA-binding response OmpR family regulator